MKMGHRKFDVMMFIEKDDDKDNYESACINANYWLDDTNHSKRNVKYKGLYQRPLSTEFHKIKVN